MEVAEWTMARLGFIDIKLPSSLSIMTSQAQIVKFTQSKRNFEAYYHQIMQKFKRLNGRLSAESIEKQIMLLKILSGLCCELASQGRAVECLDQALLVMASYLYG